MGGSTQEQQAWTGALYGAGGGGLASAAGAQALSGGLWPQPGCCPCWHLQLTSFGKAAVCSPMSSAPDDDAPIVGSQPQSSAWAPGAGVRPVWRGGRDACALGLTEWRRKVQLRCVLCPGSPPLLERLGKASYKK